MTPEEHRPLCAIHPDQPAEATCVRCGNYMCDGCSDHRKYEHCPDCRERLGIGSFPLSRDDWTISAVLEIAWERFKQGWVHYTMATFLLYLIVFGLGFVMQIVQFVAAGLGEAAMLGVSLASSVLQNLVQGVLQLGLFAMCLDGMTGRPANLVRLFSQWNKLVKVLVQFLVIMAGALVLALPLGLVVALVDGDALGPALIIGTLVLIVPFTYVALGLFFMQYELAYDEDAGPIEAIGRSWALARGARWPLLGIALINMLVVLGGVLMCCVGLLAALPLASLVTSGAFLALRNGSGIGEPTRRA